MTTKERVRRTHYELKLCEDNGTMFVHAREGTPKPAWDDYYPALKDDYVAQAASAT